MSMIQKGWNLKGEVDVLDMDKNIFVFQFVERDDYFKVLRGRPWAIQTYLLNIQLWDNDMLLKEVLFDKYPVWVQFHGLPFVFMNQENAVRLGSEVGKVVMVEDPKRDDKIVRNFLRARIILNIHDPLVTGFWVSRVNKKDVWTEVKYERIPMFCYKCGIIGHEQRNCLSILPNSKEESEFGGWLKAFPLRAMEDLVRKVDSQWCEQVEPQLSRARGVKPVLKQLFDTQVHRNGYVTARGGSRGMEGTEAVTQEMTKARNKAQDVEVRKLTEEKEEAIKAHANETTSVFLGSPPKAHHILPIGSPMKLFYELSPCSKKSVGLVVDSTNESHKVKEAGG